MIKNITEMSERSVEYHVIARRWKSDLEFFKIESAFLNSLKQDYYFTRLSDYRNKEALKKAADKLHKLQADISKAESKVDAQLHQLTKVAENKIAENSQKLALANAAVGHLMISLTHEYQEIKKEIFASIETIFRKLELSAGKKEPIIKVLN
jgi:Skp family chaperone for outer membrane proteins